MRPQLDLIPKDIISNLQLVSLLLTGLDFNNDKQTQSILEQEFVKLINSQQQTSVPVIDKDYYPIFSEDTINKLINSSIPIEHKLSFITRFLTCFTQITDHTKEQIINFLYTNFQFIKQYNENYLFTILHLISNLDKSLYTKIFQFYEIINDSFVIIDYLTLYPETFSEFQLKIPPKILVHLPLYLWYKKISLEYLVKYYFQPQPNKKNNDIDYDTFTLILSQLNPSITKQQLLSVKSRCPTKEFKHYINLFIQHYLPQNQILINTQFNKLIFPKPNLNWKSGHVIDNLMIKLLSKLPDLVFNETISNQTKLFLEQEIISYCFYQNNFQFLGYLYLLSPQSLSLIWQYKTLFSIQDISSFVRVLCENNLFTEQMVNQLDTEFGLFFIIQNAESLSKTQTTEPLFHKYFDYFITHNRKEYVYYLLQFQNLLPKIPKNILIDIEKIHSSSPIPYEIIRDHFNRVTGSVAYTELKLQNPIQVFKSLPTNYEKQVLIETNPSFSEQDLVYIYTHTQSPQIKAAVINHPNCPNTLKLKNTVK